jgi:hypothetical protein
MYIYTQVLLKALARTESRSQHLSKLTAKITSHHFNMRLTVVIITATLALVSYVSPRLINSFIINMRDA